MVAASPPVVLFVDDEPDLLEGVRLGLRRQPFDVVTTTSVEEAFRLLDTRPVAAVVSDERMPEMAGSRFLAEVRHRHPDVERIILTGHASTEATIAAINDARVFRFLTKPCASSDLSETLTEALAAREIRLAGHDPSTVERHVVEQLEAALEQASIVLQPIVDANGRLFAHECLLRTDHEVLSNPTQLLDAAVRLARQGDVDRRVRRHAAEVLSTSDVGAALFVNLVPDSLLDPLLHSDDDPLAPWAHRVVLEVTERVDLDTIPGVDEAVGRLRARGFRIALDDLGSGFSGLTSFARLQPDVVKFDMALVRGVHGNTTRGGLIRSMTRLCRDMGILTVAEGVEEREELDEVLRLGCDLIQGYLIGRPASAPSTSVDWVR